MDLLVNDPEIPREGLNVRGQSWCNTSSWYTENTKAPILVHLADLNGGGMIEYREKKVILSGSPYEQHRSQEAHRNAIWFIDKKNQVAVIPMKWKDWVHVTKLDPDKQLKPGDIDVIAASGTDALMLSGTLNVTKENLAALQKQVKTYNLPLVMEPAGPEAVLMQGIDYVFVPSVINSTDVQWIVGKHRAWVSLQKGKIPWETIVPEAYIVLNPDSAVGRVTKAICNLRPSEVAAYATIADHYFHFPIIYIEYSGTYGDPNVVKSVSDVLDTSLLYYGGGINSAEKAAQMSKFADTIVVGNAVYDQGAAVLKATVDAIQ